MHLLRHVAVFFPECPGKSFSLGKLSGKDPCGFEFDFNLSPKTRKFLFNDIFTVFQIQFQPVSL